MSGGSAATPPDQLRFYARMCGQTLARGHARSGDASAVSAYLGKSDRMDRAVAEFADAYTASNQSDYQAFIDAIDTGRLEVNELR